MMKLIEQFESPEAEEVSELSRNENWVFCELVINCLMTFYESSRELTGDCWNSSWVCVKIKTFSCCSTINSNAVIVKSVEFFCKITSHSFTNLHSGNEVIFCSAEKHKNNKISQFEPFGSARRSFKVFTRETRW